MDVPERVFILCCMIQDSINFFIYYIMHVWNEYITHDNLSVLFVFADFCFSGKIQYVIMISN